MMFLDRESCREPVRRHVPEDAIVSDPYSRVEVVTDVGRATAFQGLDKSENMPHISPLSVCSTLTMRVTWKKGKG